MGTGTVGADTSRRPSAVWFAPRRPGRGVLLTPARSPEARKPTRRSHDRLAARSGAPAGRLRLYGKPCPEDLTAIQAAHEAAGGRSMDENREGEGATLRRGHPDSAPRTEHRRTFRRDVLGSRMQPHDMEPPRPDPGNDNDPTSKGRQMTFWLLIAIVGLLAAIVVNLLGRL